MATTSPGKRRRQAQPIWVSSTHNDKKYLAYLIEENGDTCTILWDDYDSIEHVPRARISSLLPQRSCRRRSVKPPPSDQSTPAEGVLAHVPNVSVASLPTVSVNQPNGEQERAPVSESEEDTATKQNHSNPTGETEQVLESITSQQLPSSSEKQRVEATEDSNSEESVSANMEHGKQDSPTTSDSTTAAETDPVLQNIASQSSLFTRKRGVETMEDGSVGENLSLEDGKQDSSATSTQQTDSSTVETEQVLESVASQSSSSSSQRQSVEAMEDGSAAANVSMEDVSPKKIPVQVRKEASERAALLGLSFDECPDNPTIKFVRGNEQRRQEGEQWLGEIRESLNQSGQGRRSSNQELYAEHEKGMPPPHIYRNEVFGDKDMLPESCTSIKPLTNAEFKKDLKEVHNYNDFLHQTSKDAREAVSSIPAFQGAAIRSMPQKEGDVWREWLKRNVDVRNIIESLRNANEEENSDKKPPFKYAYHGATFHDQTPGTEQQISAYYSHKDKVGNLVCFCPLTGESYNLVAVQSSNRKRKGKEKEQAELDPRYGSYKLYQKYKDGLSEADLSMVEKFEADFLKKATDLRLPRVFVYKLRAADKLAFAAADYLHGTIIPANDNGIRRSLLVFHDLIPYESFEY